MSDKLPQSVLAAHKNHKAYFTMNYALHVSQIQPYIENEESFRKICHGGPKQNPIFDRFLIF